MRIFKNAVEYLQKNQYVKLISIIVSVCTIVIVIYSFFQTKYYDMKIIELQSALERLTPTSNKSTTNLSNFFVNRNDILNQNNSKNCKFDEEYLFYYSLSSYWKFEKMNPVKFIHFINNENISPELDSSKDNFSFIWFSKFQIDLNNPEYIDVLKNTPNPITVDSTDDSKVIAFIKKPTFLRQYIKLTRYNNDKSFIKRRNLRSHYEVIDSVSFREMGFKYFISEFIDNIFNDIYSSLPNSIAYTEIDKLSMEDNWFFMSALSVFGGKNISDGLKHTVYSFNEYYIFYTELNTFVLEIQTPSLEPIRRGEQFIELNLWLSNFKVVTKQ